jgi:hypothetical protein
VAVADFDAADFDAAEADAADFAEVERAARGFAGGFDADSDSEDVAGWRDAPRAPVVLRGARGAVDDPRSADTPVPVPSGCSSFGSERETEVTTQTYQPPPREPSRDVTPRDVDGTCASTVRRITIALRPCQGVSAEAEGQIS